VRNISIILSLLLLLIGCAGQLQTQKIYDVPNLPQDQISQLFVNGHVAWIFKNHNSLDQVNLNGKPVKISGVKLLHLIPGKYTITGKHTIIRYLIPQSDASRKASMVGGFLLLGAVGIHAFTGGSPVGSVVDFKMDFKVKANHNYCLVRRLNGSKEVFRFQELPPIMATSQNTNNISFEITKRTGAYSPIRAVLDDGQEIKTYFEITTYDVPVVSPDGNRIAFGNSPLFSGKGKAAIVADGIENGNFDKIGLQHIAFSPDSKKLAYLVKKTDQWIALVDGKEVGRFDSFSNESGLFFGFPFFSPDSQHVAVAGNLNDRWCVYVDGQKGKDYDGIIPNTPIFSPDSKKIAYGAKLNDKWCVVINESETKFYDYILWDSIVFSPNSDQIAYGAISNEKVFVVVNDQEGDSHTDILIGTPVFSPDGQHIAYAGKKNGKWAVFIDGKESASFEKIDVHFDGKNYTSLKFDPSGKNLLCETDMGKQVISVWK